MRWFGRCDQPIRDGAILRIMCNVCGQEYKPTKAGGLACGC